ncbi:MAG: TIGR00730 family Rossman fold protein, partial [Pseudomonadota bacterium]|nr:TIGR00730 family Rossman fold protein [Pseudomonadota bacterium]
EGYKVEAARLGRTLAERDLGLVYGGASVGLMGAVADAVINAGGRAVGVIPQSLIDMEIAHSGLADLHVVDSMHERKALMAQLSDGFIALPGGIGTLEELFEIMTFAQLRFHQKPCGLLNIEGYYDQLIGFLNNAQAEGFVSSAQTRYLLVDQTVDGLLDRFNGI